MKAEVPQVLLRSYVPALRLPFWHAVPSQRICAFLPTLTAYPHSQVSTSFWLSAVPYHPRPAGWPSMFPRCFRHSSLSLISQAPAGFSCGPLPKLRNVLHRVADLAARPHLRLSLFALLFKGLAEAR